MSVPNKQHERWRMLVSGQLKHEFASVPLALMMSRIKRDYVKDPGRLANLIEEAHAFFFKYERVLTDDIAKIFGK